MGWGTNVKGGEETSRWSPRGAPWKALLAVLRARWARRGPGPLQAPSPRRRDPEPQRTRGAGGAERGAEQGRRAAGLRAASGGQGPPGCPIPPRAAPGPPVGRRMEGGGARGPRAGGRVLTPRAQGSPSPPSPQRREVAVRPSVLSPPVGRRPRARAMNQLRGEGRGAGVTGKPRGAPRTCAISRPAAHSWHFWDPQEFASLWSRGRRTRPPRTLDPRTRRPGGDRGERKWERPGKEKWKPKTPQARASRCCWALRPHGGRRGTATHSPGPGERRATCYPHLHRARGLHLVFRSFF